MPEKRGCDLKQTEVDEKLLNVKNMIELIVLQERLNILINNGQETSWKPMMNQENNSFLNFLNKVSHNGAAVI